MTMVSAEGSLGRCGREPSRSPPTVLRNGVADTGAVRPVAQARGRGSPRRPCATSAGDHGAGAGVQATGREQRAWPLRSGAFTEAMRPSVQRALPRLTQARPVRRPAHPRRSRLTEKRGPSDGRLARSEVVHRAGSWMSPDGQRLARARFFLHAGERLLARRIGASHEPGRGSEGPGARGVAQRAPRGAVALPRRGLGTCDEAAGRHDIWPAGEALAGLDCIPQYQAAERADPRDRAPPVERVGVVRLGCGADGPLHGAPQLVVVAHQRAVDGDALVPRGSGKALGDASAVGLRGPLLAKRGPGVRAVGGLDLGESLGSLAHDV